MAILAAGLTLTVAPQAGFAPLTVYARVVSEEPLSCDPIEWDWGDGCVSTHEESCGTDGPGHLRASARHRYYAAAPRGPEDEVGSYQVTVTVGGRIARATVLVAASAAAEDAR